MILELQSATAMGVKTASKINLADLVSKLEKKLNFETDLKWRNIFILGFMHFYGAYWSYNYAFPAKWGTLALAFYLFLASGSGITCGVHRLWTHRSYKAVPLMRVILMLNFASAAQNSIYDWVRDHRVHHKFSDTPADPHNVNRGFFFSHIGWLLMKKNKHVIEKGKQIDMSDIESDPVAMFDMKYHNILAVLCGFVLPTLADIYLIGEDWKCAVAWMCFIKFLCVLHAEMTVNSLAHMFGYKPYNKDINPTQSVFVATLTGGEGWHNYHHMFPFDYKAAETFDFMNWSTLYLRSCAKIGWVYDLKEASPELVDAVIRKRGGRA